MRTLLLFILLSSYLGIGQILPTPSSNYASGIYTTDISVEIFTAEAGAQIFYTLNGNEPTTGDYLYTGPILLQNRNGDPNGYSEIPTNPSFTYPVGGYDETRANNRGWLPPYGEVYKVNVLRFRAFKPGFAPSQIVTQTFMIDPAGATKYSMPVVSIVVDSIDMFSEESGYYVYGDTTDPPANYSYKGEEWERMLHFELLDDAGDLAYQQEVRSRIHGGGSRHAPKKSLRLYGNTGDISNFQYPFFEGTEQEQFKRLLIKAGGHRIDCFPRDDLGNLITRGLNIDQQHYRHIILFVNGEYWGIHSIKERMDKYFFQNIYGIDDDLITVLDQEYDVQDGYPSDSLEMDMLEEFIVVNDMSDPAHYEYVLDRIDVENYLDYMCSEIFLSNEDWVYSNVVMWRKTGAYEEGKGSAYDGKFRWALYDLDGAFGGSCDEAYYTVNTLEAATVETGTFSSYSRFFRGLLENETFKRDFINRMCDLTNSYFLESILDQHLDSMYNELTPEMLENTERWRYHSVADNLADRALETPSLTQWDYVFDRLNLFTERRQRKVKEHIMLKWGYPDTSHLTVDVNDTDMGRVQVNSILINENLPGTTPMLYPWDGIYIDSVEIPLIAIPLPGYEFVEWLETGETEDTIYVNLNSDTVYTAVFAPSASYENVLINEVMLNNDTYYADAFGEFDDWSELYNPNPYPINMSGSELRFNGQTWIIPNGTIVEANSYLLFWHDGETYQGMNHAHYKLPNVDDTLYLYSDNGAMIDYLAFNATVNDHSYGRFPNGSASYTEFDSPTPLMNNDYTSTEEIERQIFPLKAYPNPTNGIVYLSKVIDFKLFDLNGQLLQSGIQENVLNVKSLDNGIYVLASSSGETLKIVIQK